MSRTATAAHQYFMDIKRRFATQEYAIVAQQEDGIPVCDNPSDIIYFTRLLQMNETYTGILTDNERDAYIDYCLKLLL